MKAELIQEENKIEYPCLKRNKMSGCIVLFLDPNSGTVLRDNIPLSDEGKFYSTFNNLHHQYYELLKENEKVILSNEE